MAAACPEQENLQLRRAIGSHARIGQALAVLIAVHRIPPAAGFEVLREVSQHTNIKLHTGLEQGRRGLCLCCGPARGRRTAAKS
ncbi:ANTAR domain-containing protein [Streptomyces sp. 3330]|uniref:ANTAR domain-containing protein n=1 Tax=Streptomyces sp. 3330 TaxID=2817755 RepID=UPI00286BA5E8|nr:ANTAR domain-containing protein [Streptomyces sp. 3330]